MGLGLCPLNHLTNPEGEAILKLYYVDRTFTHFATTKIDALKKKKKGPDKFVIESHAFKDPNL